MSNPNTIRAGATNKAKASPADTSTDTMSEVERARTEFAATVGALQEKLNVARSVREACGRMREARLRFRIRLRFARDNNPAMLVGLASGAAAIAGLVGWVAIRTLRRRG